MATALLPQRNTIPQELIQTEKLENYVETQLFHMQSLRWVIAAQDDNISHLQDYRDDLTDFVLQQVKNNVLAAIEGLPKHDVILNKVSGQLVDVSPREPKETLTAVPKQG